MTGLTLLLGAAALAFAVAKALRAPPLPFLIVAGLALGSVVELSVQLLEDALILGVTFLLFATGVELNPRRVRGQRRVALRVGVLQFLGLGLAGIVAAAALGFSGQSVLYLALALTASSTLVSVRLLRHRGQMFEPFGRVVIGVLLLQDLLVILLIPLVTSAPDGAGAVLAGLASVAAMTALAAASWRWVAPAVVRLDGDEEALLLATVALLFAFTGVAAWLGLPLMVGAFLGGVSLSGFPARAVVRPQLASLGDFFSAIFFTALGALVGIPTGTEIVQALALGGLVVVLTPPLVTVVGHWSGLSARPAIEAGLLLAQTSEISLVVCLYGVVAGQIPASLFTVVCLATLATMLATPMLATDRVAWFLMHIHPVLRRGQELPPLRGHVVVLGSGTTGMPLLETLLSSSCDVVVIDDDPDVVARLREADLKVIRGDATDLKVLEQAAARDARIIISTIRRPQDNLRLLEYTRHVPVIVRVFEASDADWVRAQGGTPVVYSEAAAEGLLSWLDSKAGIPPVPGLADAG